MAPVHDLKYALAARLVQTTKGALVAAAPAIAERSAHTLARRGLSVTDTQKVTLGVIAVYVVVIALLWNLPIVRWSLWPFKVRLLLFDVLS